MNSNDYPNMAVIKGLVATSIGFIFIFLAYKILIKMILFICGSALVYYGLQQLNLSGLHHFVASAKSHLRRFLS